MYKVIVCSLLLLLSYGSQAANHVLSVGVTSAEDNVGQAAAQRFAQLFSNAQVLTGVSAQQGALKKALRSIAKRSQPTDSVIIYYFGDTLVQDGQVYFGAKESIRENKKPAHRARVTGSGDLDKKTLFSVEALQKAIAKIDAQQMLLIFDAPHSAAMCRQLGPALAQQAANLLLLCSESQPNNPQPHLLSLLEAQPGNSLDAIQLLQNLLSSEHPGQPIAAFSGRNFTLQRR